MRQCPQGGSCDPTTFEDVSVTVTTDKDGKPVTIRTPIKWTACKKCHQRF